MLKGEQNNAPLSVFVFVRLAVERSAVSQTFEMLFDGRKGSRFAATTRSSELSWEPFARRFPRPDSPGASSAPRWYKPDSARRHLSRLPLLPDLPSSSTIQ